jgi:hypothetical protein
MFELLVQEEGSGWQMHQHGPDSSMASSSLPQPFVGTVDSTSPGIMMLCNRFNAYLSSAEPAGCRMLFSKECISLCKGSCSGGPKTYIEMRRRRFGSDIEYATEAPVGRCYEDVSSGRRSTILPEVQRVARRVSGCLSQISGAYLGSVASKTSIGTVPLDMMLSQTL